MSRMALNPKTGLQVPMKRTRWEVLEDTPMFGKDPGFIEGLLPGGVNPKG